MALLFPSRSFAQDVSSTAPRPEKTEEKPPYPLLERTFASSLTPDQRRALGDHSTLEQTAAALTPGQKADIRKRLDAARADATTPDALKELAHGYLLLNEPGPQGGQNVVAIGARLRELEPKQPGGYSIAAEGYYRQGDYPAAAEQARRALSLSGGADKAALSILKMSEGRSSATPAPASAAATIIAPDGVTDARAGFTIPAKNDISPQAMPFVRQAVVARQKGDMETTWASVQAAMNADPTSVQVQQLYAFAKEDHAKYADTMDYLRRSKEAMAAGRGDEAVSWAQKAADRSGDASVRGILEMRKKQNAQLTHAPVQPEAPKNGAPLWPIGAGLGLAAAYGVYRSKQTWSSEDGLAPSPELTPEQMRSKNLKTAMFAGAALIGIAAWELGPAALTAARTLFAAAGPAAPTAQLAVAGTGGAIAADRALVLAGAKAAGATAVLVGAGAITHDNISYAKSRQEASREPPRNPTVLHDSAHPLDPSSVKDTKLRNIIKSLFKPTDRLPGGTSGAVENEILTGKPTGNTFHIQKAEYTIRGLDNVLKNPNLDPGDRAIAENLKNDLIKALATEPPVIP